jgi:hypothetical protein
MLSSSGFANEYIQMSLPLLLLLLLEIRLFFCGLQPTQDLKHTMAGLLRLHMSLSNEALGDEQVLAVYPTTIRRYACWDACMCVYLTCCHLRGHIA